MKTTDHIFWRCFIICAAASPPQSLHVQNVCAVRKWNVFSHRGSVAEQVEWGSAGRLYSHHVQISECVIFWISNMVVCRRCSSDFPSPSSAGDWSQADVNHHAGLEDSVQQYFLLFLTPDRTRNPPTHVFPLLCSLHWLSVLPGTQPANRKAD